MPSSRTPTPPPGSVRHYQVLDLVGEGGMGVVYRALDTKLRRQVALKRLRPDRFSSQESLRLLMNEARAASRLSHPNIVRIYDAFESEGVAWIVMEFVDGRSLRERLRERGAPGTGEILRYAEELASALGAAHGLGVLHRDVKPCNILITHDAHARLTDFGVACANPTPGQESAAITLSDAALRAEGATGTPGYMSPEQVLGRRVDPRSDLFSLGLVIYEMCTGRAAFTASPDGNAADAILHREPVAIAQLNPAIPGELVRIVGKAMARRPEDRYQEAGDLVADLRRLRRSLDSGEVIIRRDGRRPPVTRRRAVIAAVVVLTIAAAILVPWLIKSGFGGLISDGLGGAWHPPAAVPHQLTSDPGWEAQPRLSPDGDLVAFTSNEAGNPDIWLIDVRGGAPLRLTEDPATDEHPAWFPDGKAIAFNSDRGGRRSIWKVPRLGGSPLLLLPDASDPSVSPDGTRIAFSKANAEGRFRIHVAPVSNAAQARVLTGDGDGLYYHYNPSWSPDGKTLCYEAWRSIWTVPVSGGRARRLIEEHSVSEAPTWSPDGQSIYFSSTRERTRAIWRIPVTGGTPTRVTLGSGPETQPDVSSDGRRFVYSTHVANWDILIFDRLKGSTTRLGGVRNESEPALSPDGNRLVFVSDRDGSDQLWMQPLVDGQPRGLPVKLAEILEGVSHPGFSPDGRWISFYRKSEGQRDIWVMPADGGPPVAFTDDPANDIHPAWSPDGSWIAFASDRAGPTDIWVAPVSDGRPAGPARRITSGGCLDWFPDVSPDGSSIVFLRTCGQTAEVWTVPADGSTAGSKVAGLEARSTMAWDPSTGRLLVMESWIAGSVEVRLVDTSTGRTSSLAPPLTIHYEEDFGVLSPSRDGRFIALMVEDSRGDLWAWEAARGAY